MGDTPFSVQEFPQININAIDIADNVALINNNIANITAVQNKANQNESDITAVQTKANQNESDITAVQTKANTNETDITGIVGVIRNIQQTTYTGNVNLPDPNDNDGFLPISQLAVSLTSTIAGSRLLIQAMINVSAQTSTAPVRLTLYSNITGTGIDPLPINVLRGASNGNRVRSSCVGESDTDYGLSSCCIQGIIDAPFMSVGQEITITPYYNVRQSTGHLNRSDDGVNDTRSSLTASSIILTELYPVS